MLLPVISYASAVCKLNGEVVACPDFGAVFFGFFGVMWAVMVLFMISATVFWILMIIHVATHPIENKAIWVLLLIFTGIIGAIVYYFGIKRPFDAKHTVVSAPSTSQNQTPSSGNPTSQA